MAIIVDEQRMLFHLQGSKSSYIFRVVEEGILEHVYWGAKLHDMNAEHLVQYRTRSSFSPPFAGNRKRSFDTLMQEFPGYGYGDSRQPVYAARLANGTGITRLTYRSYRILQGKPSLDGLPATYSEADHEADTLEMELFDEHSGLAVWLSYSLFHEHNAIARSVRYENRSKSNMTLEQALSVSVDFAHSGFDMLQLSGAWSRERNLDRRSLAPGIQGIDSRRGSSSHPFNPFIALLSKGADEDAGEVYGFSLVYSGSFSAQVEVDQYRTTRVVMGIQPFQFNWLLEPGQSFQAPEVVLVYSSQGIGGMSRAYHRLYRTRLCRGEYRDQLRPIVANNWEATFFNFNEEKITSIAEAAGELGIELFVLDDGWFGARDNSSSSLGDWTVHQGKLPGGLASLADRIKQQGMQFGLWFEPEMVSPDSELYRKHPDWCLHVPNYERTEARQQLVLDFSRKDVREAIVAMVSDILTNVPISYVKWDMNRNMTEIGSALLPPDRQAETAHRYMLGLYEVMEQLTTAYPHILFESCSGGGGRFDPGMLYYMPQTWTSDNTDAIERLKIQYGTSIVYPVSSIGAHISDVPNHQVGRLTSLEVRGHAAMSGNFGYELDLTKLDDQEKAQMKTQVVLYKEIRPLVQQGDFYRLSSPFESNETAWIFVNELQTEAVCMWFRVLKTANDPIVRIQMKGLDPNQKYSVTEAGFADPERVPVEFVCGGDELMHYGLTIPGDKGDFKSGMWRFKAVPE
ncbi:alpha-galactosidase [Paenibacillus sp. GXUN7292]|uniref:alpha-galactosidase n=1 Tax=Paenibacillus sp. GXUN7292 TaxID=3422499 RepID=UPI003D7CE35E